MKTKLILAFASSLLFAGCMSISEQEKSNTLEGQHDDNFNVQSADDLFSILEEIRRDEKLAGLTAAIVSDSQVLAIGAAGERMKSSKDWITLSDIFYVGSNHKSMTAVLSGILVDRGIISWDSTMEEVFPELDSKMNEQMKTVSLEHLLSHRSGIPRNYFVKSSDKLEGSPLERRYNLVKGSSVISPEFKPGQGVLYSNTGYNVAGAMLERKTGKPIEALFDEYVLSPLGLSSYGFGRRPKNGQPLGHHFLTGQTWNPPFFPAREPEFSEYISGSGAYCDTIDFSKYAIFLLTSLRGESPLLREETSDYMYYRPGKRALGLGAYPKYTHFSHRGAHADFWCDMHFYPKKNIGIIIFTNEGNAKRVSRAFAQVRLKLMEIAEENHNKAEQF